jgi:hypothetical protein
MPNKIGASLYFSNAPMQQRRNDFKVEKIIFKELMVHPPPFVAEVIAGPG